MPVVDYPAYIGNKRYKESALVLIYFNINIFVTCAVCRRPDDYYPILLLIGLNFPVGNVLILTSNEIYFLT